MANSFLVLFLLLDTIFAVKCSVNCIFDRKRVQVIENIQTTHVLGEASWVRDRSDLQIILKVYLKALEYKITTNYIE